MINYSLKMIFTILKLKYFYGIFVKLLSLRLRKNDIQFLRQGIRVFYNKNSQASFKSL